MIPLKKENATVLCEFLPESAAILFWGMAQPGHLW
jgi:hypothetical protein